MYPAPSGPSYHQSNFFARIAATPNSDPPIIQKPSAWNWYYSQRETAWLWVGLGPFLPKDSYLLGFMLPLRGCLGCWDYYWE
jgi:hypothetical protein